LLKTIGIILVALIVVIFLGVIAFKQIIRPWYLAWGATPAETSASLPGDELLPQPAVIQTNAITIRAAPEKIWPWIAQLGQARGGFYSLESLENLAGCDIHNADRIVPEWQNVQPGDLVRMYPKEKNGPPPYIVADALPDRALILGHHPDAALTGDTWTDTWQFILQPDSPQNTRLIVRVRTNMVGGVWDVVEPVAFIMQRAMMYGIRDRAERPA
jgi:hypothetical protein